MIFPVVFGLPAMVPAIPPLVMRAPAALSFGVQLMPPLIGLVAVLASALDCSI
jgi:hypothetical protein